MKKSIFYLKKKNSMKIRNLKKSDLLQLSKLYEQFWGEKSDVSKMEEQFNIIENEKNHIILVAESSNSIVGSVMGIVCKELYGDCRPFLVVENMVVDKNFRKKGIGTLLLKELETAANKLNCTQMILVTEADRADACGFYEKYGFQKNNKGYKKKI